MILLPGKNKYVMSGIKSAVLDSNILIYCSKRQIDFRALATQYDQIFVSVITYIETLGYPFGSDEEKNVIEKILEALEVVQTDMEIACQVVAYKQLRKVKTPDAIILATARKLNSELVTVNEADFKNLDPAVPIIVPTLIAL